MDFDFDTMMDLARTDPEEFERRRSNLLDEIIRNQPDIDCAKAFQSRIDMERRKARTPLGCCVRLYSMMWDSFYKLDEKCHEFDPHHEHKAAHSGESKKPTSAKILMFRKREE